MYYIEHITSQDVIIHPCSVYDVRCMDGITNHVILFRVNIFTFSCLLIHVDHSLVLTTYLVNQYVLSFI